MLIVAALLGSLAAIVAVRYRTTDDGGVTADGSVSGDGNDARGAQWDKAQWDNAQRDNAQRALSSGVLPTALAYRAQGGTLYDVDWRVGTTVPVRGLAPQSTALDLGGIVQVTELGVDGTRRLVGVRLVSLRSATMTALGQPLYADAAAAAAELVDQPVVLALSADGAAEDVYLEPSTSPMAKNVLTALALNFGIVLPRRSPETGTAPAAAGAGYVATEPGDFGPVAWNYTRAGDRLVKSTDTEQGRGRGEVRFEGALPAEIHSELVLGGVPAGVIENDPAASPPSGQGSTSFRATRQGNGSDSAAPWPSPDLSRLERHAPDARPSPVDETASNLAVANGFTSEDLQFMVGALGNGQKPRKGDLIRAAGFMRANPTSCDTLAAQFEASPPRAQEFILDLLSSSGDTKAQAVMRAVLAMPVARRDPVLYQHMLQRFAFVDEPNAESVAFVFAQWESAKRVHDDGWRQASAYTLGSLAFHAQRSDNAELAASILRSLLRELDASTDVDVELGLIASIGNTGMAAAREPILLRASSKDVRLRSQAAISLRKFDDEGIRQGLVALVGDEDLQVAQSALRSLDTQTIGEVELTTLAERVERGLTLVSADPALVTFVAAHLKHAKPAERILRAVAARVGDRFRLKDQVDNALAALASSEQDKAARFQTN